MQANPHPSSSDVLPATPADRQGRHPARTAAAAVLVCALAASLAPMHASAAAGGPSSGLNPGGIEYRLNGAAAYQPSLNLTWLTNTLTFDDMARAMGGSRVLQDLVASPPHHAVQETWSRYSIPIWVDPGVRVWGYRLGNWEGASPGYLYDFFGSAQTFTTMRWWAAKAFAQYLNGIEYLGFDDWRLPQTLPGGRDCITNVHAGFVPGFDCPGRATNEIQALAYDLGKVEGTAFDSRTFHPVHFRGFTESATYWLDDEFSNYRITPDGPVLVGTDFHNALAVGGDTGDFNPLARDKYWSHYQVMVVRDGDVTLGSTPPIPEPGTWALMLAGLGAMVWRARRIRRDD